MTKRIGAVSADTRERILSAAGAEFAERGFSGSSLRRISTAAGVTTGAIYFFFPGKEELFETVLSAVTDPFLAFMRGHYAAERSPRQSSAAQEDADYEIGMKLIEFYFSSRQGWDILLQHLGHPAVQRFLDSFVEESTAHYLAVLSQAAPESKAPDPFAIHQFVHMQVDTMLTLISHDFSREEMQAHSHTVTKMLRGAFHALLAD